LIPKSKRVAFHAEVLQASKEVRRRVWRVVGVGVGLLRHDGEVEGIVVKDDVVLVLCVRGRACYAQAHIPKRRSHHCVTCVLTRRLLRKEELARCPVSAIVIKASFNLISFPRLITTLT